MITNVSALLDRKTRAKVLADDLRGQAIYRLRRAGLFVQDTAEVLNCSRSIVWNLLAPQFPQARRLALSSPPEDDPPDLESMSRNERYLALYQPPGTEKEIAEGNEELAHHLAAEVRRWLSAFEARDLDRRYAIEGAGVSLDRSPLNAVGEYVFDVDRAVLEAERVWRPKTIDRGLITRLGRGLACWIRFWITDPIIWNRALDLEYTYFGERAEAAALAA